MKTTIRCKACILGLFILTILYSTIYAQVGINTVTPGAGSLLDVTSTEKGIFIPKVEITVLSTIAPITGVTGAAAELAAAGLLVYNTDTTTGPGYFYWNGTDWVAVGDGDGDDDWKLIGNAGTTAGTNFLGTTDGQALQIRTNNTERMRVLSNGQVSVNDPTPIAGDLFTAVASGNDFAINGYASGTGSGVYGENSSTGDGAVGVSNTGNGVVGVSTAGAGAIGLGNTWGVIGETASNGYGVYGYADNAGAIAGRMSNLNSTGISMVVTGQARPYLAYTGGAATFSGTNGLFSIGTSDGLLVAGNSLTPTSIVANTSGTTSIGNNFGIVTWSNNSTGTGLVGMGNGLTGATTITGGSGLAGSGTYYGVVGISTESTSNPGNGNIGSAGGYFANGHGGFAAVGAWVGQNNGNGGDQNFKIFGTGAVSTIVKDVNENAVIMYAPESPECLFQDYGIGALVNGQAVITLDPNLSKNIRVDQERPLKVFIQLEGDCNGVFVTNKSANGFTVKELQGGRNNVPFSWSIVATRADEVFYNKRGEARVSINSQRFPLAPPPLEITTAESREIKTVKASNNLEETSLRSSYNKSKD